METQIGNLVTADLKEGTLTICVGDDIDAVAGHYAVVPITEYTRLNNIVNEAQREMDRNRLLDIMVSVRERTIDVDEAIDCVWAMELETTSTLDIPDIKVCVCCREDSLYNKIYDGEMCATCGLTIRHTP